MSDTRSWMDVEPSFDHPAKFSPQILERIELVLWDEVGRRADDQPTILDPFGGIGGIHWLGEPEDRRFTYDTYAIEIEPEWARASATRGPTWCGDWFKYQLGLDIEPFRWGEHCEHAAWLHAVDAIVTSCTYANRMADHHEAKDDTRRMTYRHRLGRMLHHRNSGAMQWGDSYRWFHQRAWRRARDILDASGGTVLILNVKDHVRKGKIMRVAEWHRETIVKLGFEVAQDIRVPVKGMLMGENYELRVEHEHIYVFHRVK